MNKDDLNYIEKTDWLEFMCDYEDKKNNRINKSKKKTMTFYVNVKRNCIEMVKQNIKDKSKSIIYLRNNESLIVNMPYEKIMELV